MARQDAMGAEADDEWKHTTRQLMAEQRARITELQAEIADAQRTLDGLETALHAYEQRYGRRRAVNVQNLDIQQSEELRAAFEGLSHVQKVERWASEHGGEVIMRDMVAALTAAGVFASQRRAAGALTPAVLRNPGLVRVSRGVYRRVAEDTPPYPEDIPVASTETDNERDKWNELDERSECVTEDDQPTKEVVAHQKS